MADSSKRETLGFQTEVRQLLQLMIHSLYSNKEIFLRELISNASDAADKLRFESLADPGLLGNDTELAVRIEVDAEKQQLAIVDNGIGMSRDELIDNLGTIARSGTAEFLQKMTGDQQHDAQLIGQFGVGFYSSFIVADKVTVETRRAGLDATAAVRWESDGQGEYTIEGIERAERGTRVTLHLKDDEKEFAESFRIESLIRKYSDHIGFPVSLLAADSEDKEAKLVNSATALWTRARSDISDDEYREFYKYLTHDFADPLVWSHNQVEGKREYTSLLYIPAAAPFDLWNREAPRGLKLYVQRVFIMDEAEQFLPLYLRFVKGVIDSSDLPLNVSRELLQQNPELVTMRSALTRRVLDMLQKMASGDADKYQTVWREFGQVLKEGVIEDHANKEKLARLLRFATTNSGKEEQDQALEDYVGRCEPGQDKIYYILAENYATAVASPHLEQLKKRDVEVLLLTDRIDPWLVDALAEFDGKTLVDVAGSELDLPEGEQKEPEEDKASKEHEALLKKMGQALEDRVADVKVSRRLVDSPACVVAGADDLNPQLRRMLEASGQAIPESKPVLEVNVEHPLVGRLSNEADKRRFADLSNIVMDHALLAEGSQLDNPAQYVQRMNKLLLDIESGATHE
ncbi:MAG: molecular chaperone HtpG [Woeseiaceae bacterium]